MRLLAPLFLVLLSCAGSTAPDSLGCSPEYMADRFYKEVAKHGVTLDQNVRMVMADPLSICTETKTAVGCAAGKYVELKTSWWNKASCQMREALVFHELGHAELLLDHQNGTLMDEYVDVGYKCLEGARDACIKQAVDRFKGKVGLLYDASLFKIQTRKLHRHDHRMCPVLSRAR